MPADSDLYLGARHSLQISFIMSTGNSIGGTITGGIQDIAALLPLLGTEQCEDHIASGLTDGYLYVAATPMSIFGSLGVARAGFKTLLSAISIPQLKFNGAKVLADAGFKPQGTKSVAHHV
jgi:hypothetical protein